MVLRKDEFSVMFEGDGPGAFLPALTPELLEWLTGSAESISRALLRAGINDRTYRSVLRAAMAIGGFVPDLYVLADGRQRADFSIRQLGRALGHGENSLGVVQQALRVLSLTTRQSDPGCYRAACEALAAERAGNPIVRCIHKSSNRGESSIWELVDIRPRENTSDPTVSDFSDPVSGSLANVVDSDGTVPDWDETVSENASEKRPACDVTPMKVERVPSKNAEEDDYASGLETASRRVDNGAFEPGENDTTSTSATKNKLLYEKEFDKFLEAYGHGPGRKRQATYRAFLSRIEHGYEPEALICAAGRYRRAPYERGLGEDGAKYIYPLRFLENEACLKAYGSKSREPKEWTLEEAEIKCFRMGGKTAFVVKDRQGLGHSIAFSQPLPRSAQEARELICGPMREWAMGQMGL